jgi:hypothetical protein|tara:strand:+ start:338 stop:829 length:492 start_codon:yes stop_codon:yes gene_type:complete
MELEVIRFSSGTDSTNGMLFETIQQGNEIDGIWKQKKFLAYTLEDEQRDDKVFGETRIPNGTYELGLRKVGGYHAKYSKRFDDIHIGMLHVLDVPNFEYILIHCGNTDEHTAGCLLVGDSQENNQITTNGFIGKSTQAYKRIYPRIASALERGEKVTITYKTI